MRIDQHGPRADRRASRKVLLPSEEQIATKMTSAGSSRGRGPSVEEAIEWLAEQRRHPDRQSHRIVEYGTTVIENVNITRRLGDDQWAFLEQVGLAALDVGNVDLAGLCVSRLDIRFPGSGRVLTMRGMLLEAQGEFKKAYDLYDEMLTSDESNLPVVKRMIAVLKCMESNKDGTTGIIGATKALNKYLDTYYNDVEGWQELVALYLDQGMYAQAAFALEELLLLVPHNSFFVLQYAEVLATMNDQGAAYKQYLRVLELCGNETPDSATQQGPFVRALWGLKVVTGKLLASSSTTQVNGKGKGNALSVASPDGKAEKVEAVDTMVTDLLLNKAYVGHSAGVKATRDAARKVLQRSM